MLFFCVLGGYFAVRPVRETVGTILGKDRVTDLYAGDVDRLHHHRATVRLALRALPALEVPAMDLRLRRPVAGGRRLCAVCATNSNIAVGQFFYVWISVLNLFIVSVFWSFLLEFFDTDQTHRLFGVIAAGGTTGALVGPLLTDLTVSSIGNSGVLYMGAAFFVVAILCQRRLLAYLGAVAAASRGAPRGEERPMGGNPFAGFSLVLKSPYLLGISLFVILLASVNTFLYFEQLRLVTETFPDIEQRTRVFSRLDYIVQGLAVVSQLFITGRIASRLGVVVLLTVIPLAMVAGFTALALMNSFWVLAFVFVARRAGEYAFIRPGREMLFSRVDTRDASTRPRT